MKKLILLAGGAALTSSIMISGTASAEVNYNMGWASDYYFRGRYSGTSSANAGVEYNNNGISVGAWTAGVGDGLEVDTYIRYEQDLFYGFKTSVGATGYFYTGDFDNTSLEINLGLEYGIASIEYSTGEWDFEEGKYYAFTALTLEH